MRRVMLCVVGVLFLVTGVYLSLRLLRDRDLLILASVAPAIVAALAFGVLLLLRVFRRKSEDAQEDLPGDDAPKTQPRP